MAFAIPKIQYKNVTGTGDTTNGSSTINDVDTEELEVGMFVRGSGIPTGAKIGTVDVGSIILASGVQATATSGDVTLNFGFEIEFEYPPIEENGETLEGNAVISESLSGVRQVAENFIEATRKPKFSFLTPVIYALVDTFLRTHAVKGKTFRYFEDKTSPAYVEYELDTLKVTPKKIAPKGVDLYTWEVPLNFRRVL